MKSNTRDAVFINKLEKIKQSVAWVEENGTEKQKRDLRSAIRSAGMVPIGGPSTDKMLRCSHEVEGISHGLSEEDLKFVNRDQREELLQEEIDTRWKLINGLKHEIRELRGLQQ